MSVNSTSSFTVNPSLSYPVTVDGTTSPTNSIQTPVVTLPTPIVEELVPTKTAMQKKVDGWLALPTPPGLKHVEIYDTCQNCSAAQNMEMLAYACELIEGKLPALPSTRHLWIILDNLQTLSSTSVQYLGNPAFKYQIFVHSQLQFITHNPPIATILILSNLMDVLEKVDKETLKGDKTKANLLIILENIALWKTYFSKLDLFFNFTISKRQTPHPFLKSFEMHNIISELWIKKIILKMNFQDMDFAIWAVTPHECNMGADLWATVSNRLLKNGYLSCCQITDLSGAAQEEMKTSKDLLIQFLEERLKKVSEAIPQLQQNVPGNMLESLMNDPGMQTLMEDMSNNTDLLSDPNLQAELRELMNNPDPSDPKSLAKVQNIMKRMSPQTLNSLNEISARMSDSNAAAPEKTQANSAEFEKIKAKLSPQKQIELAQDIMNNCSDFSTNSDEMKDLLQKYFSPEDTAQLMKLTALLAKENSTLNSVLKPISSFSPTAKASIEILRSKLNPTQEKALTQDLISLGENSSNLHKVKTVLEKYYSKEDVQALLKLMKPDQSPP